MNILAGLVKGLMIYRKDQIMNLLTTEESSKEIAEMQGELKGINFYMEQLDKNFTLFNVEPIEKVDYGDLKQSTLDQYHDLAIMETPDWEAVQEEVKVKVSWWKDFLWNRATKPKDLQKANGFKKAIELIDEVCQKINNEWDNRRREPNLPGLEEDI